MNNISITNLNRKHFKQSYERKLAELIDEVRACVGADATLAAKVGFNPRKMLNKFKILNEKVIDNIKIERQQAVLEQASQNIVDQLDLQLATITERSSVFQNYLELLASGSQLLRSDECEHSNALSNWLDEIDPLPQVEDFNQMPFQSLKADPNNVPRDFSVEDEYSAHTYSTANIDDFFLPEYIESKNEAEITEDILAKANELKNSPVKIYEWVRNNIEWQPTWGGQQTANMTLDVLRGNAMDISTLLITLLRAARIPARYVHGTIDIAIDNFINMAGNFDSLNAAMEFVSAGGIPVTGIVVGGKISKVRMEHVWVEAAVPFYPSRGSKPVSMRNPIDRWIPLDGAAKQYNYLYGINFENDLTDFDKKFTTNFINSGLIDFEESWAKGFDENIFEEGRLQLLENIKKTFALESPITVGDAIGGRLIIKQNLKMLPGSLPYLSIKRRNSFFCLKKEFQVQLTLGVGYDRLSGNYDCQKIFPFYKLNQKNITISFRAASIQDKEALESLLPTDIKDSSQLPQFLPSRIKVIPEIKQGNDILLSGQILSLGEIVRIEYEIQHPQRKYFNRYYDVIAGSYLALGVVGSNISVKNIIKIQNEIKKIKEIADHNDENEFKKISREDFLGNIFSLCVLAYYGHYVNLTKRLAQNRNMNHIMLPVIGTFGYEPYQNKLFGLIRGIDEYGMFMNVHVVNVNQDKSGNIENKKDFTFTTGVLSSTLEHAIPGQLFTDSNNTKLISDPISCVRAIGIANSLGQKIYYIKSENREEAMTKLKLDKNATSEIYSALTSGKHVITHTDQITISGFKGCGYVILDPITYEASYKISGNKNGSFIRGIATGFGAAALGMGMALGAPTLMLLALAIGLAMLIAVAILSILNSSDPMGSYGCYTGGIADGITLFSILYATPYLTKKLPNPGSTAGNNFQQLLYQIIFAKLLPYTKTGTECNFYPKLPIINP
jgi:hypothetical protein